MFCYNLYGDIMKITSVELPSVAIRQSQYPSDALPEFLVVGRSNVGKSSFVNTLTNRKNFARVSSKPGKTQTLNFYLINKDFYIVDVPGYGYASVDKVKQLKFGKMIEDYLENRKCLKEVFMLVDSRHKPSEDDVLMYNFLKYYKHKVRVIATKSDKLSVNQKDKQRKIITNTLNFDSKDDVILFSIITKDGKKEVHSCIEKYLDFIDD